MKLKKGDSVIVISGKDKGKQGIIQRSYPKLNRVVIDGVNLVKKHRKPTQANPDGTIVDMYAPINVSKERLSVMYPLIVYFSFPFDSMICFPDKEKFTASKANAFRRIPDILLFISKETGCLSRTSSPYINEYSETDSMYFTNSSSEAFRT